MYPFGVWDHSTGGDQNIMYLCWRSWPDFEFEFKESRLGQTMIIFKDYTDAPYKVIEGGDTTVTWKPLTREPFSPSSLGSRVTVVSWRLLLSWLCLFNRFCLSLRFEVAQSKLSWLKGAWCDFHWKPGDVLWIQDRLESSSKLHWLGFASDGQLALSDLTGYSISSHSAYWMLTYCILRQLFLMAKVIYSWS